MKADPEAISHWFEIIEECVEDCANYRNDRPDIFLWRARGVAEAVLSAMAEGTKHARTLSDVARGKPVNHEQVARNLAKEQRVHELLPDLLATVRRAGNIGAHAQGPSRRINQTTIQTCSDNMRNLVHWLYNHSALKRPMPDQLSRALRDLKAEGRASPEVRLGERLALADGKITDLQRALAGPSGVMPVLRRPVVPVVALVCGALFLTVAGYLAGRASRPEASATALVAPVVAPLRAAASVVPP